MIPALKEWAVLCEALGSGEQALLLRKGGISEDRFALPDREFLLFPTYVHQKEHLLKPAARPRYLATLSGHDPAAAVLVRYLARATEAFATRDERALAAVDGLHLFSESYAKERLHWRSSQPLALLLVRVYRLSSPLSVAPSPELAGCRSWIELPIASEVAGASPVLDDAAFSRLKRGLEEALSPFDVERAALG
jgi:hypothetical protein